MQKLKIYFCLALESWLASHSFKKGWLATHSKKSMRGIWLATQQEIHERNLVESSVNFLYVIGDVIYHDYLSYGNELQ